MSKILNCSLLGAAALLLAACDPTPPESTASPSASAVESVRPTTQAVSDHRAAVTGERLAAADVAAE